MKSTFQRNLLVAFGVSLLLLILSSTASFISIRNLLKTADLVQHTTQVIHATENTLSILKDAETGQRGFLLTGDESFLEPYKGAYDKALAEVENIRLLTADNPAQQRNAEALSETIRQRLQQLAILIDYKRQGMPIDKSNLDKGKRYMDETRAIVKKMTDSESSLLTDRIGELNKLAINTPLLIILAATMSIIITVIFFIRITSDFNQRSVLQKALQKKEEEVSRRITLIQDIAEKIAAGDYSIRTKDSGEDGLGSLSISVNKMAESLDYSFNLLSDKEWLQTGVAGLNTEMIGETDLSSLAVKTTAFAARYTNSQVAVLYLKETSGLVYAGGFAFAASESNRTIAIGEGIAGQVAKTGKSMLLKQVTDSDILISYATGKANPKNILAVPVFHEGNVMGVLELATLNQYSDNDLLFLESVANPIGIAVNTAENRTRLQNLFEQTQSQAEELQAQHREMENINEELEVQAQKLQASEEELKVQQEELLQANQELEERSRMLEERNQVIMERNQEIHAKAEQLALSTRYKSEFLANMSHELRTPLNSILLLSRLMSENPTQNLSEEQTEYAKVIQNSGQGLLALINEILDLSKIESGKMDLHIEPVQVQDLVNGISALFAPVAADKKIGFLIETQARVPAVFSTDRMRVEQVLKNLVSNAIKFTSEGQVRMELDLYENNPALLGFTVEDTGIGIAREKQHLVFEAFQQEDGSTRRKYGGTGLGLSISRELAKLLGGEITLQSEPGQGSRFTFILPMEPGAAITTSGITGGTAGLAEEEQPPEAEKEREPKYISTEIPMEVPDDRYRIQPADKTILIVEDDTNFAKSLLEFTRQQGYKGIVCVRGDEAVDLAKKFSPRGILLDIQLPVKDGLEVMDELKSDSLTKHIPVHMMSSYEMKYKSLSRGAIDFINKPVAFEKMRDIFEKLEYVLSGNPQKVLIVEENAKHAKALAYFLESNNVNTEIRKNVSESIETLKGKEVNCVILDMGIPDQKAYDTLEEVKSTPGLENLPIIIFTGKSLSKTEEMRIRQYADSVVIKTAYSYQRIRDEVSLFLHLVEENRKTDNATRYKKLGALNEVLKDKTVLIADDDVRNIYSLTRALESFGMQVISATDGKEALLKLQQTPKTDIILMDMMMPEMDGYETTRTIKNMQDYKRIPVIAVTAKAMLGDREKCIEAGASDYITKPVDIDQLLSLLRVWLYDQK
ncbi:response regulator [Sediminibacterium soli]|uniref:response regulator n=1 Tax=Sediminibacterium soli TaxID=2698829 RepID=UPI00137B2ADF|nr:response regulator [Sediminibacterium soli]NCI46645.1 response regulator [Sediminibacterium soli]